MSQEYPEIAPESITVHSTEVGKRVLSHPHLDAVVECYTDCLFIYRDQYCPADYYGGQFPIALDRGEIDLLIAMLNRAKEIMPALPAPLEKGVK